MAEKQVLEKDSENEKFISTIYPWIEPKILGQIISASTSKAEIGYMGSSCMFRDRPFSSFSD